MLYCTNMSNSSSHLTSVNYNDTDLFQERTLAQVGGGRESTHQYSMEDTFTSPSLCLLRICHLRPLPPLVCRRRQDTVHPVHTSWSTMTRRVRVSLKSRACCRSNRQRTRLTSSGFSGYVPQEDTRAPHDHCLCTQGMSNLSGQPIDSSATCEFPDDPSFWPKFTEQANNCPYAKRGRQYTIPYLDERPVEASFKWVKAYRDCLSENNPIEVVVSSKTVARSFRIPIGFYELFMPKTGYGTRRLL